MVRGSMPALGRSFVRAMTFLSMSGGVVCCRSAPKLDGAISQIPVYAPSSLEESHQAHTSDTISEPTKFSAYSWDLRTKDEWSKVDAFYKQAMPGATRDDGDDANDGPPKGPDTGSETPGQVVYVSVPSGFSEGENVLVYVYKTPVDGKTRFRLEETVLSNRR